MYVRLLSCFVGVWEMLVWLTFSWEACLLLDGGNLGVDDCFIHVIIYIIELGVSVDLEGLEGGWVLNPLSGCISCLSPLVY